LQLNFTFAPPSKLVTSFFISGAFFYLLASIIFYGLDFLNIVYLDPKAVGFIHLFMLGFMMSVIFGAMYQLISVVLEIPLYSNDLAFAHLGLFLVGIVPFIISFLYDGAFAYLGYGSTLLYVSFLLYIINVLLSIKKIEKFEIKAYFILTIHIILFIGVSIGLLTSLGLVHADLGFDSVSLAHKHIVLVLFGFAGGLISIIATVLIPMFMLSHNFDKKMSNYILVGIILASVSAIFSWFTLVKILIIATIIAFVYQGYDIFKKRMRKHIDVYAQDMVASGVFLLLSTLLLPFISNELAMKVFVLFLILGFISSFIIGHIYKIVPFLVWNEKFAPLVGKEKVPMLADMVDEKYAQVEFNSKLATIAFLTFGIILKSSFLIMLGKVLFILNALLVVYNVIYIFRFKG
jgi:hypothetical protein